MSINRVTISGHLGNDAELRYTQTQQPVLNFSVAVTDYRRNNQTGEYEEYVNWIRCTMFGNRAEKLVQYLTKGAKVAIDGKLRYSSWVDKSGGNRSSLEVMVSDIELLSRDSQQKAQTTGPQTQPQTAPQATPQTYGSGGQYPPQNQAGYASRQIPMYQQQTPSLYDEDLPF